VLCLEYQYLRAITGAADGKIRIWNILNGACIRVMRGNSQCDPVLSLNTVDNRLVINTDNNILLMEFEKIQYEYNTTISLESSAANEALKSDEQKRLKNSNSKNNRNHSLIRASRSELIGTPNVKLFNDDRKSVLGHSARPISGKDLRHAQILNNITSKAVNVAPNSAGHISEFALQKRLTLLQSINAVLANNKAASTTVGNTQTASALSSYNTSTKSQSSKDTDQEYTQNIIKNIEMHRETALQLKELENMRNKELSLIETKTMLREQLKDIKEKEQLPEQVRQEQKNAEQLNLELESCVETQLIHMQKKRFNDIGLSLIRPTSSPSRVDTKTKIRIKQRDLDLIKSMKLDEEREILLRDEESELLIKQQPVTPKHIDIIPSDFNEEIRRIELKSEVLVSKIFEFKEKDLETNTKMYPTNVKSKLPNPKIMSSIRLKTASSINTMSMFNTRAKSAKIKTLKEDQEKNNQPKLSQNLVPILFSRPKTAIESRHNPHRINDFSRDLNNYNNNNKLISSAELNLMTSREVDELINSINQTKSYLTDYEKEQETRNKELYKKLWLLKSKGEYHGSLLAQTRSIAPEIRE
jgi:hypothetical protein